MRNKLNNKLSIYNNEAFTLVEVIITIAIIGIIIILAVPSMISVLESSQATQQSHDFISAIQFSLTEAGKQNANVTICAKKAAVNECVTYTTTPTLDTWQNGWLLFADSNDNGTYEPGQDTLLKTQVNNTNKINIKAVSSAITLSPDGVVTRGEGTYYFSPTKCNASNGHRIILYKSGQVSTKGGVCPQ